LTSISLSNVIRIGSGAFVNSPITSFSLPKIETIGHTAFYSVVLTSEFNFQSILTIGDSTFCQSHFQRINLPNATSLSVSTFYSSPVTLLNIPKVLGLENGVFNTFWSIVNSKSERNKKVRNLLFNKKVTARFIKLVALEGFDNQNFASLAEIKIIQN